MEQRTLAKDNPLELRSSFEEELGAPGEQAKMHTASRFRLVLHAAVLAASIAFGGIFSYQK